MSRRDKKRASMALTAKGSIADLKRIQELLLVILEIAALLEASRITEAGILTSASYRMVIFSVQKLNIGMQCVFVAMRDDRTLLSFLGLSRSLSVG
jgi:hypothetical protein